MTAIEALWEAIKSVQSAQDKNLADRTADDVTRQKHNAFYIGRIQGLHDAIAILEHTNIENS